LLIALLAFNFTLPGGSGSAWTLNQPLADGLGGRLVVFAPWRRPRGMSSAAASSHADRAAPWTLFFGTVPLLAGCGKGADAAVISPPAPAAMNRHGRR